MEYPQLKVTAVQAYLQWEDKETNLHHFRQLLERKKENTDLIVLPEMFNTGFSMKVLDLAEKMEGNTMQWMGKIASKENAVVCGSLIIEESGHFFNRLIWMKPDRSYDQYDKRHLFSMAKEERTFTAGNKKIITEWRGWKICPQVCYDLRFPVWNRNKEGYDLLINIANWPERRSFAWRSLLIARAIENQSYVTGLNRVGEDGNGIYHSGNSAFIDPVGKIIWEHTHEEAVKTVTLSKEAVAKTRRKFPFLRDADDFELKGILRDN